MGSSWQSPADKIVEALYEHPRNYVSCMKSTGHGHPIWHFRGRRYTEFSIGDIGFWHDEWFPVHINISRPAPSIFSVTRVSPKTQHYPISDKILRSDNVIQPLELISPQSVATEVPIPSDADSYQCVHVHPQSVHTLTKNAELQYLKSLLIRRQMRRLE